MANLVNNFCIKQSFIDPITDQEEDAFRFFKLPLPKPVPKSYKLESLISKIGGAQFISQALADKISSGQPVCASLKILDSETDECLIPTLFSLRSLASRWQKKYGIEIHIVSENEAALAIEKIVQSNDRSPQGMIVYKEGSYHISPILLYPEESQWTAAVMDCVRSKDYMQKLTRDLAKNPIKDLQLLLSYGTRLADGNSCRIEGMTLLKYALHWAKGIWPICLSDFLNPRKSMLGELPILEFKVPKQWAVAAQVKDGLQGAPLLDGDFINHKKETYGQWKERHPPRLVSIKVAIYDPEYPEDLAQNTYQKAMSFFLMDKVKRLAIHY